MAAPFDPRRLEVTGGAVVVLESVRQGVNADHTDFDTLSGQFAFSSSGALVYVPGGVWPDHQDSLVWVDREGRTEPLSVPTGPYGFPRLSPDGTRIAVTVFGFEQIDIWVYDIARGTMTRLTLEEGDDTFPVWTPDSTRIAFSSNRSGVYDISWIPADGSAPAEELSTLDATPASWSPDGQGLACVFWNDSGNSDIWMHPLEGEPRPFIESRFDERGPEFSPDGHWLAYSSNQSGRREVYVTPYPGPGPRVQLSDDGGGAPAWSPDGRELFYRRWIESEGIYSTRSAEIITEPSFSSGRTRELFTQDIVPGTPTRNYDIAPDGKRFLMVAEGPQQEDRVTQIHVTLNWFEELKRLAPTE